MSNAVDEFEDMAGDLVKPAVDTIFPGARQAGEAGSQAVMNLIPKPPQPGAAPAAPPAPASPDNSSAIAARNAAAEEARRRAQFGRASTNPTGGLGLTAPASVAAKQLLGY